ncbi:TonB-dependent receptor [Silanimonas sp.]|uniref:TonB-dependent receptor plug domain-containing protein n=1 Tax=Silanimonas sp. TaxID=1929290 RepID=UPI001BC27D4A|nr:TonB-dependent receptor [Silanimonas sp.]MBS3895320.1 TonB-dependent receptor [Silanimonas sp.]MBS3923696.1 TonB-dependent receptor [Xanthomonadaceae bacterium]
MNRPALLAAAIASALALPGLAHAQTPAVPTPPTEASAQDEARVLDAVIVTGTRFEGRSAADTVAPVDSIPIQQLERKGSTELSQALSLALPSFNFPRPGLTDGTDTVRPATLRGLAPDQTLVLVNGKRRHASALVNLNNTVGRGSAAVDLNTIPTVALRGVEVLRDGASAQYGSDAIAGVINVLLREADEGGGISISHGRRMSEYTVPVTPFAVIRTPVVGGVQAGAPLTPNWAQPTTVTREVDDGATTTVAGWKGLSLAGVGFLTLSFEHRDQERTERDGYDNRQQYPLLPGNLFDPREATIDRFNAWYGEPDVRQTTLFANAGIDLEGGAELYGWASWQDRQAVSAGFFRTPRDARNVPQIYPDGFLPQIAPQVVDASAAGGIRWNWGDWAMDSSLSWGSNVMDFTIQNTLNRSQGAASQRVFDAGAIEYAQTVFNFGGTRALAVNGLYSDLFLAVGLEARNENYQIHAGEPSSWINGGVLLNAAPTAPGAQVFPGFRPANEVDASRNAVGIYLDTETNLSERMMVAGAVRAERYSDFGSNVTGKLASRFNFSDGFALRGSIQNGFRAPSPQQQFFTSTATNFIGGVPFDITTFPVADPVAIALGARPLEAEESINLGLGAVFNFGQASLTIDAYAIDIDNRIVLSENLIQASVRNFLTAQGFVGIGGGRFFLNGVDTETRGVDVVFNLPIETATAGRFDLTLTGNVNETSVTRTPTTAPIAAIDPNIRLFDRVNVLIFEEGNPRNKFGANLDWTLGRFSATLRATRYGEALNPGSNNPLEAGLDFRIPAEVLIDLEGRVQFSERWELAIGADNLTDTYPEPFPVNITVNSQQRTLNPTGNTPFSNYSPFGRSGRFVYGRLNYRF